MSELAGSIRRSLWAIIDHYDEALEPARMTASVKAATKSEPGEKMKYAAKVVATSPPPIGLHVIEARMAAHADLSHFCRVVLMEVTDIEGGTIQTRLDPADPLNLARFLITWAERMVEEVPNEAERCDEDMRTHSKALEAIAAPDRRDWILLGHCPFVIDGLFCHGRVRGFGDERSPACDGCEQEGPTEWWEEVMFGAPSVKTLTYAELIPFIHRAFGVAVKRATLRTWIKREVITTAGTDDQGRTLYNREDVLKALSPRLVA